MKRLYLVAILLLLITPARHVVGQTHNFQTLVSYNGLTSYGQRNRDSVFQALENLGFKQFDTVDRNAYGSTPLDYTSWCTLIWASGDPMVPVVAREATGQAGLSGKEIGEVEQFLKTGLSYSKKSLIIAGQNIAYQHGYIRPNEGTIDTAFLQSFLHTKFAADCPDSGGYRGLITGEQTDYWNVADKIESESPDVIRPARSTPQVGPEVNWWAYSYGQHTMVSTDSGSGITYYNPNINTVFFSFDWADPVQTPPYRSPDPALISGVTRVMRGALDFDQSHAQTCYGKYEVDPIDQLNFELGQTIPNPTTQGQTQFQFTLPVRSISTLRLLDISGRVVRTEFENESFEAGEFNRRVNLSKLPSGSYFYELTAVDEWGKTVRLSKRMEIEK